VRVKSDPFEELDTDRRKAVLWTICGALLVVVYAIAFPRWAGVVAMIAALLVIIVLHEAGHFFAAKRSGMKVTEFFAGFGPRLWSFRRGETEYGIKALPFGGYCKIIGMSNIEEIDAADEARTYMSKPWHQRVFVAFAGPAMNILIALVLMFTVLFVAGDYKHERLLTKLAAVTQGAKQAGLQPGDQIIAINGTAVDSWDQVHNAIVGPANVPRHVGDVIHVVARRGNQVLDFPVTMEQSTATKVPTPIAGVVAQAYVPHPGFMTALSQAPRQSADVAIESVKALGRIFSPAGIMNYVHLFNGDKNANPNDRLISPVGYGEIVYHLSSWVEAMGLLIVLNIFLALFNLLPLFPLDGGHIAVASYEEIASRVRHRRVRVNAEKLLPIAAAVVSVVVIMGVASLLLDITRPVHPF
jgi:membrane-associated protease RseP (regulator of RpoE activity)